MASKVIGVEFGSDTVKFAVCKGNTVKKMAVARMPSDLIREGRITSQQAMVVFLKQVMKEYHISGGNCALVLPSSCVIGHTVTMPVMGERELLLNLPYEFRDFVGKDASLYDYDYIYQGEHDNIMTLYAAAVRRDLVEDFYTVLKHAGLTLRCAIPAEMAWSNLIAAAPDAPGKVCIVDMGHNTTRVNIFNNGDFVMGKDVELAGSLLDETIASYQNVDSYVGRNRKEANLNYVMSEEYMNEAYQAISIEVMKILNFYNYNDSDFNEKLTNIYYCGGSAVIEPLRTALLKNTGMVLHHIERLLNSDEVSSDLALYCALAAGAAFQM